MWRFIFSRRPIYPRPFRFRHANRSLSRGYKPNSNRQQVINQLQKDPNIIRTSGAIQSQASLNWGTIILLVGVSSSATMALYLGVQVYRASKDEENKTRHVFLPLRFSFDWPYQRKCNFPSYLKYVDPAFHQQISSNEDFLKELFDQDVHYQVLDILFRSKTVRDLFGVPLSLRADDMEDFLIWVEPKYPTVHGPVIQITKNDGKLNLSWKWAIKSIKCLSIEGFLTGLGLKLDRIKPTEAQIKTHEKSSGRIHEAVNPNVPTVFSGDKDYSIVFGGKLHLESKQNIQCGVVNYTGLIDFNHMGISKGVKITSLELTVNSNNKEMVYKLR
ncbi:hypothetical protein CLUG_01141 [Clavispora lusitaniae ATCC 42720]|uniref:Uncharacterized protein n=1 Tax=Clavispora lusitaniae (strain ATCC 42720) TaxID=306902 RepID=C4XYW8_CLAL4|nr:uncharacterized protein CLUG_01141 [Clavispora lusitaniae ATCC 42720]EEQ37018.1 hypothetical protein CLUG_01141 [Clavispora lusitaniae ATCC 42720]